MKKSNSVQWLAIKFALFLVVGVFYNTVTNAQQVSNPRGGAAGSWRLIGTTSASHTADHDVINVVGAHDYFRRLKFKVTDAPLVMERMIVAYDDGAPEKIDIRFNIPQGGESRVIDLKGGRRKIRSVSFWYQTKGFLQGKADVTLFGMK